MEVGGVYAASLQVVPVTVAVAVQVDVDDSRRAGRPLIVIEHLSRCCDGAASI